MAKKHKFLIAFSTCVGFGSIVVAFTMATGGYFAFFMGIGFAGLVLAMFLNEKYANCTPSELEKMRLNSKQVAASFESQRRYNNFVRPHIHE